MAKSIVHHVLYNEAPKSPTKANAPFRFASVLKMEILEDEAGKDGVSAPLPMTG
ncbi:hypothetical protein QT235_15345 [Geobacillus stearothermophilus]|nr:hypothetical protein QT235_15345 [Geobacillus stearothermophilus]